MDPAPVWNSHEFMRTVCECGKEVRVVRIKDDPEYQLKFECVCGKKVKLKIDNNQKE